MADSRLARATALSIIFIAGTLAPAKAGGFYGKAAYYSHHGKTANGGRFNPHGLTAAHRTLPFGTRLRVTDPRTGRHVVVTVTDRGPFGRGRVLDVSLGAARALGMISRGVIYVRADIM